MKNRVKDGYADGKECINQLFDINYRFKKILIFFVLQYFFTAGHLVPADFQLFII